MQVSPREQSTREAQAQETGCTRPRHFALLSPFSRLVLKPKGTLHNSHTRVGNQGRCEEQQTRQGCGDDCLVIMTTGILDKGSCQPRAFHPWAGGRAWQREPCCPGARGRGTAFSDLSNLGLQRPRGPGGLDSLGLIPSLLGNLRRQPKGERESVGSHPPVRPWLRFSLSVRPPTLAETPPPLFDSSERTPLHTIPHPSPFPSGLHKGLPRPPFPSLRSPRQSKGNRGIPPAHPPASRLRVLDPSRPHPLSL